VPKVKYDIEKFNIVKNIFNKNKGVYGIGMILAQCIHDKVKISHNTIARYMKIGNLVCINRKKFKHYKNDDPKNTNYHRPDLINRDFKSTRYMEKVFTDVTCVPISEKNLYISFVIETYSNRIVG
jgi:spermidine/putrescine-binding protein